MEINQFTKNLDYMSNISVVNIIMSPLMKQGFCPARVRPAFNRTTPAPDWSTGQGLLPVLNPSLSKYTPAQIFDENRLYPCQGQASI